MVPSIAYIEDWVSAIDLVVTSNDIEIALLDMDLSSDDSFHPESIYQQIAITTTSTTGFQKKIDDFLSKPRMAIESVYDLYTQTRNELSSIVPSKIHETLKGVATTINDETNNDQKTRILRYILQGKCMNRLGEEILKPNEYVEDAYFEILLDVARIIFETQADEKLSLPWLANNSDMESLKHIKWEKQAGQLAEDTGGAVGRAVSASVTGIISPFVKLPDEASKAIGLLFGLMARKTAEAVMHKEINLHPDVYN